MNQRNYSFGPVDDALEEYLSIAAESLCSSDRASWQLYVDRVGQENVRGIYAGPQAAGTRLVGGMAFYRMGQWFGGKKLGCAGFAGVAVSPTDRGTGACAAMLRAVLSELKAERIPLASLFASTQYLYRTVGFEHAGSQTEYSIPIRSLGCNDHDVEIHRFESPDLAGLDFAADARAEATNGNLGRTVGLWQRLLEPYGGQGSATYLIGDVKRPEGFAILRLGSRDAGHPQPLVSTDVAANTPRALRRLIALVRDHRSMCDTFQWFGAPNDPIHFLADEQAISVKRFVRWMLRIVDLPAALRGRGYPIDVEGQLDLQISDQTLPENSGRWRMQVADGQATVQPGGDGTLSMDISSLAPLYSSFYSAEQLVGYGAIESKCQSQTRLATQIFAGPQPWIPDMF